MILCVYQTLQCRVKQMYEFFFLIRKSRDHRMDAECDQKNSNYTTNVRNNPTEEGKGKMLQ